MGWFDQDLVSRNDVKNSRPDPRINYLRVFARLNEHEEIETDFEKLRKEKYERIR
jgi:hypothetical protein